MSRTATNMKKLIERKFYDTAEECYAKLDLLMLANRITDEEYMTLIALVEEYYPEVVEEEDTEPTEEETETDLGETETTEPTTEE